MYNLETEFKKFYSNEVVLSQSQTSNLREKKNLNIKRLREGLEEYNKDNKSIYKIAETLEQGSVAMATVTQSEEADYDIDVAIVFDENNISSIGPNAIKNIVVDALTRKCTNFKTPPEAKTNCVRIVYSDNYHIDFAIYKRIKNQDGSYTYEHAGSEWRPRDPRAINNWFKGQIKTHGDKLRKAVRLSKMFCKSRSDWAMPGGLIQTVLCNERIQDYDRLDEMFCYTMKEVRDRLNQNTEVNNPTDTQQSLLLKQADKNKVNNLHSRLTAYLAKLDVLFKSDCNKEKAIGAWHEFYNHEFWTYEDESENNKVLLSEVSKGFASEGTDICHDTEEYINNLMPVVLSKKVSINCLIDKDGKFTGILKDRLKRGEKVHIGEKLYFYIESTNVQGNYDVYLKVKNVGRQAEILNCIRGEIFNMKDVELKAGKYHYEEASFEGEHFVECYIQQNGVCVAMDFLLVPII